MPKRAHDREAKHVKHHQVHIATKFFTSILKDEGRKTSRRAHAMLKRMIVDTVTRSMLLHCSAQPLTQPVLKNNNKYYY